MESNSNALGIAIRKFRTERGLTEQQFADMVGLSKGYISMLEHGKNPRSGRPISTSADTFIKIRNVIGAEANKILNGQMADSEQKTSFGISRLQELRQEAGLTQEEFRQQFNSRYHRSYTPSAISRFENSKRIPETSALVDFADFFGVSVDELFGHDVKERRNQEETSCTDDDKQDATIGKRLKTLRIRRGYSQDDVAKLLGIGRTTYLKYESGENKPSRKLKELAALFGVTTDYLLGCTKESDTNDDISKIFSERLSRMLDERGMSQRDFARLIGVSCPAVNDWLKGRKMPLMGRIDKICKVLSIGRAKLMGQDDVQAADNLLDLGNYIQMHDAIRFDGKTYHLDESDKDVLWAAVRVALHRIPPSP